MVWFIRLTRVLWLETGLRVPAKGADFADRLAKRMAPDRVPHVPTDVRRLASRAPSPRDESGQGKDTPDTRSICATRGASHYAPGALSGAVTHNRQHSS